MSRIATRRVDADRPAAEDDTDTRPEPPAAAGFLSAHTAAGTCHLHPGYHSETTTLPDEALASVDGLVLEAAESRYEALELDHLRTNNQYETLLVASLDGPRVPVYAVDIPRQGGVSADRGAWFAEVLELLAVAGGLAVVGTIGLFLGVLLAPVLWVPLLVLLAVGYLPSRLVQRPGRAGRALRRTLAYAQLVNAYSLAAARSAAVAETLDAYLLPYLRAELDRRPELIVDYGVAHLDIYAYLRHPRLRRAVLWCYRRHNVTGRDWSHVDRALAFEFDDLTTWNAIETDDGVRYKRVLLEFDHD